jgi:hypothetical protein
LIQNNIYSKQIKQEIQPSNITATEVEEMMGIGQHWHVVDGGDGRHITLEDGRKWPAYGLKTPKKHKENNEKTGRRGGRD